MKIGLVTVYYCNYGSYFQALALKKVLDNLGYECDVINATIRGRHIIKFVLGEIGHKIFPKKMNEYIASKNSAFRVYLSLVNHFDELNITPPYFNMHRISKKYDCIVIGSDELWSASLDEMKYIPAYWGIHIHCPHIAYATSAASLDIKAKLPWNQMTHGLKSFAALSGRDEKTCNIIQSLTKKACPRCIDPVLLNPYFIDRTVNLEPYLLVYGVEFAKDEIKKIKQYARKNNLIIRGIAWKHEWFDEFYDLTSPQDFLNQFAKAQYCVVSTFHGTVFSILHHKNFAAFLAGTKATKVKDLLKLLEIDFRIVTSEIDLFTLKELDYDKVERRLEELRTHSLTYLQNTLQTIETQRTH